MKSDTEHALGSNMFLVTKLQLQNREMQSAHSAFTHQMKLTEAEQNS